MLSDGIKRYFLLLSIMAENKRINKIFFQNASQRPGLESSQMRWRFGFLVLFVRIFVVEKPIKTRGECVNILK